MAVSREVASYQGQQEIVDAINGFTLSGVAQKAVWFDSVSSMQRADIPAGATAATRGYTTVNDGGNAFYYIREKTQSDVEDGGSIIFLDNGNVAELIVYGIVTPEQFGAYGDGTHDDTQALQNTLDFAEEVYLGKTYLITSPLIVDHCRVMRGSFYKNMSANTGIITSDDCKIALLHLSGTGGKTSRLALENLCVTGKLEKNQAFMCAVEELELRMTNCCVRRCDAVFAGKFGTSSVVGCRFYQVDKAFILGFNESNQAYTFDEHRDLVNAIETASGSAIQGVFGEGWFVNCYISGQGGSHDYTALFVNNRLGLFFDNCYIDYFSAFDIDVNYSNAGNEPTTFNNCIIDSIMTLYHSTRTGHFPTGLNIYNSKFCRLNSSYKSELGATGYHFIDPSLWTSSNLRNIHIKNTIYATTSGLDAKYSSLMLYNGNFGVVLQDFVFDFIPRNAETDIRSVTELKYYQVNGDKYPNSFAYMKGRELSSLPITTFVSGNCQSFEGDVFKYNNDIYMVVMGTKIKLTNNS